MLYSAGWDSVPDAYPYCSREPSYVSPAGVVGDPDKVRAPWAGADIENRMAKAVSFEAATLEQACGAIAKMAAPGCDEALGQAWARDRVPSPTWPSGSPHRSRAAGQGSRHHCSARTWQTSAPSGCHAQGTYGASASHGHSQQSLD